MRRALNLAARGQGQVSPSPLVGCVIGSDNEQVFGEGFYLYDKIEHAEAIALRQAGELARGATAYVTLEPHNHHSKTPPCTDALINAGIKRVVTAIVDPNPLVNGQGFEHLRRAGVEVVTGVLADEAARLNEKYIHWHTAKRPFVHLKTAMSLDGRIATRTGDSQWITGAAARQRVHDLRHEYDAILIGSNTAAIDDPLLTDRSGKLRRHPLVRVVLDDSLRLSAQSNLARTAREYPTIVFTKSDQTGKIKELESCGVEISVIKGGARNLDEILDKLKQREIQSVLIEGGATVAGAFHDAGLVDKISFFVAPLVIGGRNAPTTIGGLGAEKLTDATKLTNIESKSWGDDWEIVGYPIRNDGERKHRV